MPAYKRHVSKIHMQAKSTGAENYKIKYELISRFELKRIFDPLTLVQPIKAGVKALTKLDVRMEIDPILKDIKIVGSGLCITAISTGLVCFYNFKSGQHLYDLNTQSLYPFKAIKQAIFMDVSSA